MKLLPAMALGLAAMTNAPAQGELPDTDYIASLLFDATSDRRVLPDIVRVNPALDDVALYAVQRRFIELHLERGRHIGGYKGGFIPQASIGAVLFGDGFLDGRPVLTRDTFHTLMVEAEIGFRLCEPRTQPFRSVAALRDAVCWVFPAIELPDAALADLARLRADPDHLRRILIATNMVASHVLVGPLRTSENLAFDLNRIDVRVTRDGETLGRRDGATSTDDIWARVLWTIDEFALARGYTIEPHHVIIPGALTGLHAGEPGHYRVEYGALGNVEFEIR